AFGGVDLIVGELVAEPLEAAAGGEHAAEDAPLAGDGVAHGMNASPGVAGWGIAVGEDDAGCAEGGADDSSRDDTVSDGACGLISGAADNGDSLRQTQGGGSLGAQGSGDFRGFVEARKQHLVDLQFPEQLI